MRISKALLGDHMGKAFVYKGLPGKGYNQPDQDSRPQNVAMGIVYYDSYEDYEKYFLTSLKILRQDVKNVSDIRAYANIYEVMEIPEEPLNETERKDLDTYIANAE